MHLDVRGNLKVRGCQGLLAIARRSVDYVLKVMTDLARGGMTMVVVTHEMGFARQAADRVVFMHQGCIVESASPEEFFDNPRHERTKQFLRSIH